MASDLLTPEQIAELRRNVMKAQDRPNEGREIVRCVGGPLDGLRVRIDPCWVFGWCCLTRRGPVVSNYKRGDRPCEWVFEGYSRPGWEHEPGLGACFREREQPGTK